MGLLEKLLQLQATKIRPAGVPKSRFGRGGVENTPEVKRILGLPSYRWQDDPDLPWLAEALEDWLGLGDRQCPETCVCKGSGRMHLRPVQVAALQAIHDIGGLFGALRVGGGKTLISYLAGSVLEAERTLLLIPAKLKAKTERDFALLRRHWVSPKRLHIMSYELLSRDRGVRELEAYKPDLVVCDESHKVKSLGAACAKRLRRYLQEMSTDAKYVDMSGTVTKRSIREYAHRIHWAIPDGLQPIPRKYEEIQDWADALDEKTSPTGRLMPGALMQFCNDDEIREIAKDPRKSTSIRIVRQAYCKRLMTAPGVCGTEEQFDGAMSLTIEAKEFSPGLSVVEAFSMLREDWALPDGQPIDQAITLWRAARELIQGFFYRWDPEPPKEWLIARREWARMVREALHAYRDLDTPLTVARAVDQGRIAWAEPALRAWRNIKDTFTPVTVPVWIDDACLKFAEQWAKDHRGIVWVHEVAFGEKLSEVSGLPYYGAQGLCGKKPIEDERETCIASIQANAEGRNLQQFSENLIVSCPPGGAVWEQCLGRTHRDGQEADEVTADVILGCFEQWDVFRQARRDAEYIERTTAQCQKLNFADVLVQDEKDIEKRHAQGDPLWCKDNAKFFDRQDEWTVEEKEIASLSAYERSRRRKGLTD